MKKIETTDVPQANSLHRVCDLLALVGEGIEDKQDLTRQLGLVTRELDYYKHAARILGFAHFDPPDFYLTENGKGYLAGLGSEEKHLILASAVRAANVFKELLSQFQEKELDKDIVTTFLLERTMNSLSGIGLNRTTARRRADTMIAWLKYTRD
jgi:hypothetical protein